MQELKLSQTLCLQPPQCSPGPALADLPASPALESIRATSTTILETWVQSSREPSSVGAPCLR